jgi:hypothetical protein
MRSQLDIACEVRTELDDVAGELATQQVTWEAHKVELDVLPVYGVGF